MRWDDIEKYVIKHKASGIYRYYRRVPTEVQHLESRTHVKASLKTKNLKEALERAETIHRATEKLWRAMLAGNDNASSMAQYGAAVKAAQSLGFTYQPMIDVADLPIAELERRVAIAQQHIDRSSTIVHAVMGTAATPSPRISDIWSLYEEHNRAGLLGMSHGQMAKHKISRERALRYAQDLLGDMELSAIKRTDVLRFRDWWTSKIESEGLKAYSANRSFSDIAGMLAAIDTALHTEYRKPWTQARIKETNATKLGKRESFSNEFIQEKLLAPGALDAMNEDARLIVYTMVETGCRLGEVCNLRPEDIKLDDEIPHIEIAERDDRRQKTSHSVRRIPLVGISLWAMKQRPNGFRRYQDKADVASALINKVLKSSDLRPTTRHTIYSLRHSFQQRIENAGASDRMQTDLMGHSFDRPVYGDGSEMKRRQEFLDGIKFNWPQ
ncbi:DUF6538 domain-containing protein [Rhizobium puerariae]|uniref:DUF6538 domain-containing protein n=1 Tax=Rhizobium puerariae TaxID=1585791 RepID=A0ABV6AQM5_9HYPH